LALSDRFGASLLDQGSMEIATSYPHGGGGLPLLPILGRTAGQKWVAK